MEVKLESGIIAFLDLLPIPVFMMDTQGKFVYANQGVERIYGYTKEELLKLSLSDLGINEEDIEIHQKVLHYSLTNRKERRLLRKHRIKDASEIDVDVQWNVIEIEGKSYILSCIREITEQQEVVRSYERAIDIMSKVVKELSQEV